MIEAVIFDMDGVLINTKPQIEAFWQHWAKQSGFSISREDMEQHIHGCPGAHTLEVVFKDVDPQLKAQIKSASAVAGVDFKQLAVPGAVVLVQALQQAGVPKALVTSAKLPTATKVLQALGIAACLPVVVTADQVERGKPHPDPYLLAAARLGVDADRALVFEDSLSGARAAVAAGMAVVGLNEAHAAESLHKEGARWVIPDFREARVQERGEQLWLTLKRGMEFQLNIQPNQRLA